jgi:hypothetical protein
MPFPSPIMHLLPSGLFRNPGRKGKEREMGRKREQRRRQNVSDKFRSLTKVERLG